MTETYKFWCPLCIVDIRDGPTAILHGCGHKIHQDCLIDDIHTKTGFMMRDRGHMCAICAHPFPFLRDQPRKTTSAVYAAPDLVEVIGFDWFKTGPELVTARTFDDRGGNRSQLPPLACDASRAIETGPPML